MSRPILVVSNRQPHKLAIIELVKHSNPGDLISDREIDRATDSRIAVWNSPMQAARRELAAEGIILKREHKLGYRHLKAPEKAGAADREMRRARNRVKGAKRITDSMTNEQFSSMSPGEQSHHVQTHARVALAFDMLSPRRGNAIANNAKERPMLPK